MLKYYNVVELYKVCEQCFQSSEQYKRSLALNYNEEITFDLSNTVYESIYKIYMCKVNFGKSSIDMYINLDFFNNNILLPNNILNDNSIFNDNFYSSGENIEIFDVELEYSFMVNKHGNINREVHNLFANLSTNLFHINIPLKNYLFKENTVNLWSVLEIIKKYENNFSNKIDLYAKNVLWFIEFTLEIFKDSNINLMCKILNLNFVLSDKNSINIKDIIGLYDNVFDFIINNEKIKYEDGLMISLNFFSPVFDDDAIDFYINVIMNMANLLLKYDKIFTSLNINLNSKLMTMINKNFERFRANINEISTHYFSNINCIDNNIELLGREWYFKLIK